MTRCIYLRFLYTKKLLRSGVPKPVACYRQMLQEVRRKTEICRPDRSLALVLCGFVGKNRVALGGFRFSRTSENSDNNPPSQSENAANTFGNSPLNAKTAFRRFPRTKPDVPSQGLITAITLRESPGPTIQCREASRSVFEPP